MHSNYSTDWRCSCTYAGYVIPRPCFESVTSLKLCLDLCFLLLKWNNYEVIHVYILSDCSKLNIIVDDYSVGYTSIYIRHTIPPSSHNEMSIVPTRAQFGLQISHTSLNWCVYVFRHRNIHDIIKLNFTQIPKNSKARGRVRTYATTLCLRGGRSN